MCQDTDHDEVGQQEREMHHLIYQVPNMVCRCILRSARDRGPARIVIDPAYRQYKTCLGQNSNSDIVCAVSSSFLTNACPQRSKAHICGFKPM